MVILVDQRGFEHTTVLNRQPEHFFFFFFLGGGGGGGFCDLYKSILNKVKLV